jgi:DNA-directed RNA polymerase subunit RPC12/RpoP
MLITLARFRDPWEAHMFRSRLEAEGVFALVDHQYHIGMNWPWSLALGEVKVEVLDLELEEARSVWQRCRNGAFEIELLDLFGTLDDRHCPHCGSRDYRKRRSIAASVRALILVFFLPPLPPMTWVCTCLRCGRRWED